MIDPETKTMLSSIFQKFHFIHLKGGNVTPLSKIKRKPLGGSPPIQGSAFGFIPI